MRTSKQQKSVFGILLVFLFVSQFSFAQTFTVDDSASKLIVEGTSNIHDWEIEAKGFQGDLQAVFENGQLVEIDELNFAVVAESLKSGKGGMDKKTFEALKTDDFPRIVYRLQSVNNIDCTSSRECVVTTHGYLTIAGERKPIELAFDVRNSGGKITFSGKKTINMTDFNIDPPKAMFGTITTGEEVTIDFKIAFNNQFNNYIFIK